MKHYNIPIFLPEEACPFRCVYCNQFSIAGQHKIPNPEEVKSWIIQNLQSFRCKDAHVEVAFFGGNFTGLPIAMQDRYLRVVLPFLESGEVHSIRCSTRPDYIDEQRLIQLKNMGMRHIELGAQSTNEEVLLASGRGHSYEDIVIASQMILNSGMVLGLQMMLGLPESDFDKEIQTARDIVSLGARETRIYPCLVIRDTALERHYLNKRYTPLSMDEAICRAALLTGYFTEHNVKVLRIGLHPSEDLDGAALVAGPYHHNFAEMVYTKLWQSRLSAIQGKGCRLTITTHPDERSHAIGFEAKNKKDLLRRFREVRFENDDTLERHNFTYHIDDTNRTPFIIASSLMPDEARQRLSSMGEVLWLHPTDFVYHSISTHPDIYFFLFDNKIIFAPNTPTEWLRCLGNHGISLIKGIKPLSSEHPHTTPYNACAVGNALVHNFKHTDTVVARQFSNHIHVSQGYTRCNLIALSPHHAITSDRGIEKALKDNSIEVLFVDPKHIKLSGHAHGFFPGCCGIINDNLIVCGSLSQLQEHNEIEEMAHKANLNVIELYDGPLVDIGSILSVI